MLVQEVYINATRGYQFGESDWYEPYTENIGRLFLDFQQEYGRCVGKVYIGTGIHVGWVFQKRMRYEDARRNWAGKYRGTDPDDYYIREVWVTFATDDKTPMDISRKARRSA